MKILQYFAALSVLSVYASPKLEQKVITDTSVHQYFRATQKQWQDLRTWLVSVDTNYQKRSVQKYKIELFDLFHAMCMQPLDYTALAQDGQFYDAFIGFAKELQDVISITEKDIMELKAYAETSQYFAATQHWLNLYIENLHPQVQIFENICKAVFAIIEPDFKPKKNGSILITRQTLANKWSYVFTYTKYKGQDIIAMFPSSEARQKFSNRWGSMVVATNGQYLPSIVVENNHVIESMGLDVFSRDLIGGVTLYTGTKSVPPLCVLKFSCAVSESLYQVGFSTLPEKEEEMQIFMFIVYKTLMKMHDQGEKEVLVADAMFLQGSKVEEVVEETQKAEEELEGEKEAEKVMQSRQESARVRRKAKQVLRKEFEVVQAERSHLQLANNAIDYNELKRKASELEATLKKQCEAQVAKEQGEISQAVVSLEDMSAKAAKKTNDTSKQNKRTKKEQEEEEAFEKAMRQNQIVRHTQAVKAKFDKMVQEGQIKYGQLVKIINELLAGNEYDIFRTNQDGSHTVVKADAGLCNFAKPHAARGNICEKGGAKALVEMLANAITSKVEKQMQEQVLAAQSLPAMLMEK